MTNIELPRLKCKRCGWEWTPRVKLPVACPKCRSPYWRTERKTK